MINEFKAIETEYNGYRFRSRLEARWAVFFDALGIEYEYEPEGFQFTNGDRYLPDFWIQHLRLWIEIKGRLNWETKTSKWGSFKVSPELELCRKFRDAQEWPVCCIAGTPGSEKIYFFAWDVTDSTGGNYEDDDSYWMFADGVFTLCVHPGRKDRSFIADHLCGERMPWFDHSSGDTLAVSRALLSARQARFEHGETPRFVRERA